MIFDEISNSWILGAGALGTAAFGVVEALKGTPLGTAGIGAIREAIRGQPETSLKEVFGREGFDASLRGKYRAGSSDLSTFLRNGIRLGLSTKTAVELGGAFGQDGERLLKAISVLRESKGNATENELQEARETLGRFDTAVEARISGAIAVAEGRFAMAMRGTAALLAIGAALAAEAREQHWLRALVIGFAAVPLAPVAKDLVSLLNSARAALRAKAD